MAKKTQGVPSGILCQFLSNKAKIQMTAKQKFVSVVALSLAFQVSGTQAQDKAMQLKKPEQYATAALEAAKAFPGYENLCNLESRIRNVNVPRKSRTSAQKDGSESGKKKRKPTKALALPATQIFDNLYFFGTSSVGAWLYGTEQGYILIDGLNTDEEARQYILGGMHNLGLNPHAIKHILVTHGHGDHYGGADYVAERLGLEISMSEADWKLTSFIGAHPRFGPPPQRGHVVSDGQVLRAGVSEMNLYITPGHTPGTISPVFEVYDQGNKHMAMLWGGTGFNFGPQVSIFMGYAESAAKMRRVALESGVDVYLSGHPRRDGSDKMIAKLKDRKNGQAHPFVRGEEGLLLFTVLEQCALAQAARFSSQ